MEKHPTLALVSCRAHGAAAAAVLSREMELCGQVEHDNKLSVVSIMVEKKSCQPAKILRGTGFTVHIVHMDPAFYLVMSCGHVLRDHTRGKVSVLFQRALIIARVIFVM
jgi:hypothetical protein